MRQLGKPPAVDLEMLEIAKKVFRKNKIKFIDAGDTAGQNDFLERILGLIRSTAFTVAIFSHYTRPESLANIMLELGFAAMCGKPLVIIKSEQAKAPSDLTRTDWIVYDPMQPEKFSKKLGQAVDEILGLVPYETIQLEVALRATTIDCATAFEKTLKTFLLSGDQKYIGIAREILKRLDGQPDMKEINDLERIRQEIDVFVRQAEASLPKPRRARTLRKAPATVPASK